MKLFLSLLLLFASIVSAAEYGTVTNQKIVEGVYLFRTTPYGDVGLSGNSVAIIGDDGVLVFDSNGIPESAQTVLNEIRKLTDKPVRYLVNSHWHWDHWGGNEVYQKAFPGLQIITHEKTRQLMLEVEPRWNDEGLKSGLPAYLNSLEQKLIAAKSKGAPAEEILKLQDLLKADRNFYNQKTSLRKTYPTLTFSEPMIVRQNDREIQIRHARGITAGDTWIFLPKEKILITGDILLNPYPYAIGGTFPSDWLKTLESFAALQPAVIIPGHGESVYGSQMLQNYIALFQDILNRVKENQQKGLSVKETVEKIGADTNVLASKLGITDPAMIAEFKSYFLHIFAERAYKELSEPLQDL